MSKYLSNKLILILTFTTLLFTNATALNSMYVLEECQQSNTTQLYGIKPLCINAEEIVRTNLSSVYGDDGVSYKTKSGKFTSITSKKVNGVTTWKLTTKQGLTYTFARKAPTDGVIIKTYTGNGSTQTINTGVGSIDFTKANNGTGYYLVRGSNFAVVRDDTDELISNGTFNSNTNGWSSLNASVSINNSKLLITTGSSNYGIVYQSVNTEIGKQYILSLESTKGTSNSMRVGISNTSGNNYELGVLDDKYGKEAIVFTATSTTTYINLMSVYAGSKTTYFDNVSLKEVAIDNNIKLPVNKYISKVHIKNRNKASYNHIVVDGLRGVVKYLSTNDTGIETTNIGTVTEFTSTGFMVGFDVEVNGNTDTYISYQTIYTHLKWGLTNHGKRFIEAYNPNSGETMVLYEGSGTAGHQIPQSLGRELDFITTKVLNNVNGWISQGSYIGDSSVGDYMWINETGGVTNSATLPTNITSKYIERNTNSTINGSGNTYILYGKTKSKNWTIVNYTGTGVSGNFIETKDVNGVARKPSRVITKRIDGVSEWIIGDISRGIKMIYLNLSAAEEGVDAPQSVANGFTLSDITTQMNGSGSKYIALVDFEPQEEDTKAPYKLQSISDSTNSIGLSLTNAEIKFEYENKTEDKKELYLSQITVTTPTKTSYYSVAYDSSLKASISSLLSAKDISNVLSKRLVYDENSNLVRETISGTDIETRITKYEYVKDGNISTVKKVNPLGHISLEKFDANGNLVSKTDANALTTTYEYDSNNKITKITKPNGTVTTYTYSTTNLVEGASSKTIISSTSAPSKTIYYDDKNRKIKSETLSFTGRTIVEDIVYDTNGRVSKHSLPYFKGEKSYFIKFTYDAQNRVITMDKPGQNETRLVTTYTYGANQVTINYPDSNQEVINIDGTSSNMTYEYDMLGNLVKTTDEKGMNVIYEYDILDRLIKKETYFDTDTAKKQTTYLVYDRANMGIGKLAYEKSKEYKKEYYYDELGRINAKKVLIGDKVFTTQYTYTQDDKIETTITPDGFKIINEYNNQGFLSAVKSPKQKSVALSNSQLKDLILENLSSEYKLYKEYYELKTQINFYTYKKQAYEALAPSYTTDTQIKEQLTAVASLLGETITLLQNNLSVYESVLTNYKNIRNTHLVSRLTQTNSEENYQWLMDTFEDKSKEYLSLSTQYIDKATNILEQVVSNPELLNSSLSIQKKQINSYKDISSNIVSIATEYTNLSNTYSQRYTELKLGKGTMQDSAYLGMFDDSEYKYFYKVVDTDSFGRVTNEIFGNGLVTKKEYDASSGTLLRIITGYYGNNDIKDIKYTYDIYNNLVTQYDVKNNYTKNYVYDVSNKLISASSVGSDFYANITYNYVDPSSSIYEYSQVDNKYTNKNDNTSIVLDNPNLVTNTNKELSTLYSQDSKTYKKVVTDNGKVSTLYNIDNSFKYQVKGENVKYKNLIYANGKLIAIHTEEDIGEFIIPNNYYLHKDMFDSIDLITNDLASIENKYSYRPFGQRSDESWTQTKDSDSITSLGYKGFEHDEFGYINVNGYLYDSNVAKTLTNKSVNSLEKDAKRFFIYTNPTKFVDFRFTNWFDSVTNTVNLQDYLNVNSNPLFTSEITKEIQSITSYSNVHIGTKAPTDTSKVWYKPNSEGGLDVSIYENGSWNDVGSTGSISSTGSVTVSSLNQLNTLPCFYKDKGFVKLSSSKSLAYTCSSDKSWELGGEFVGTYTTNDLVNNYASAIDNSKITVSLNVEGVSKTLQFKKVGDVWVSLDSTVQITYSQQARAAFTSLSSSTKYYTLVNDCTPTTCNGVQANGYYAGAKENNLYYFNYSTSGNRKNNLIDANIRASISAMYASSDAASLVNGQIYIKKSDNRGRAIYQKASDSTFITKAGATIPSVLVENGVVNLPTFKDATTVSFTNSAIVLDNYKQITDWTDAPASTQVSYNSKTYHHKKDATYDFWTDNITGDGQQSATQIFSSYARSKVAPITHKGVSVYTRQLCSADANCAKDNTTEPRYTDAGVTASLDANYKQWFYSLSGTVTSNLLDAVLITKQPYNSANTLAQSVGYAMYNNTLYYKSSSLWKKSSDNTNFNPCTVDSAYDDVDYTNLRCVDNYTTDSGWVYYSGFPNSNMVSIGWKSQGGYEQTISFLWGRTSNCYKKTYRNDLPSSCSNGNSRYYRGELVKSYTHRTGDSGGSSYKIRKETDITEYKSFTEF